MRQEKSSSWIIWFLVVVMATILFLVFGGCANTIKVTRTVQYADSTVTTVTEKPVSSSGYSTPYQSSYYNSYISYPYYYYGYRSSYYPYYYNSNGYYNRTSYPVRYGVTMRSSRKATVRSYSRRSTRSTGRRPTARSTRRR